MQMLDVTILQVAEAELNLVDSSIPSVTSHARSKPRVLHFLQTQLWQKLTGFPALMAAAVQFFSFALVCIGTWAVYAAAHTFFGVYLVFPMLILVCIQAIVAAICAHLIGMASWWRWIHFFFPIVVWSMLIFNIPNEFYLIGFLVTLSIFWTTFRTQVPYYPSRPDVWQQVSVITHQFKAHHHAQTIRVIDIGSGLGGLSLHLAKEHTQIQIEGIEVAPLPWLMSRVRALVARSSAVFRLGNYHALNFAEYDIIFAYLSPAAMRALWEKSSQEMRSGSLLISLEFEIPGVIPTQHIAGDGHTPDIFVFQFN